MFKLQNTSATIPTYSIYKRSNEILKGYLKSYTEYFEIFTPSKFFQCGITFIVPLGIILLAQFKSRGYQVHLQVRMFTSEALDRSRWRQRVTVLQRAFNVGYIGLAIRVAPLGQLPNLGALHISSALRTR